MAYTSPIFYFDHVLRELGVSALTGSGAATTPLDLIIDDRLDEFYISSSTPITGFSIDADRQFVTPTVTPDTLIIARGNHFTSPVTRATLFEDGDVAFGTPTTLINADPAGFDDDPIWIIPFTDTSIPERYLRLTFTLASGTKNFTMGEVWVTRAVTLTRGPEPQWRQDFLSNVQSAETDAGVQYVRVRGATRKRFRMTWRKLELADVTILRTDLLDAAANTAHPFWMQPPDDAYPLGYYRLNGDAQVRMDSPNPGALELFRVDLDFIEALG